jgi:hypothetical protein
MPGTSHKFMPVPTVSVPQMRQPSQGEAKGLPRVTQLRDTPLLDPVLDPTQLW